MHPSAVYLPTVNVFLSPFPLTCPWSLKPDHRYTCRIPEPREKEGNIRFVIGWWSWRDTSSEFVSDARYVDDERWKTNTIHYWIWLFVGIRSPINLIFSRSECRESWHCCIIVYRITVSHQRPSFRITWYIIISCAIHTNVKSGITIISANCSNTLLSKRKSANQCHDKRWVVITHRMHQSLNLLTRQYEQNWSNDLSSYPSSSSYFEWPD